MKFYDRIHEIDRLRQMRTLSYESYSRMTVVTGRRRIGKTTLIEHSLGDEPYVYFFVGRKSESVLCREFCEEFSYKSGMFTPPMNSFRDIFHYIMDVGTNRSFTLVIDEFQNFLDVNPGVFSDIQNYWDQYRKKTHVNLVVCGSVYSLMERIFKDRKEPLYGRQDETIKLNPFAPSVLKEILADNATDFNNDDLLALYAFSGGVPKYVELFIDGKMFTREKMIRMVCQQDSPFIEEGRRLLIHEFGHKYGTYFSILQAISVGRNTQAEIEDYLGGKSIGGQLAKLEETYDLIRKVRPLWAKEKTQTVRYEIADIFLRFWFRYIEKNQQLIELGQNWILEKKVREDYDTFSGDILERYFRAKLAESHRYRIIDGWWNPKGYVDTVGKRQQCELDILAVSADDKVLEIYEVKRNPDKFRKNLLKEKVAFFQQKEKEASKYEIHLGSLSLQDM